MPVNESHSRLLDMLFSRAMKRYPSHRILEKLEASITDRETAERYVDLLLSEAERQRYPSLHMIDRARRYVDRLAVADELARQERELDLS